MINSYLDRIRVLEMGALTAGPCCTRILANMGAEVIKIEQPKVGEIGRHHGTKEEAKGYFTIQNYNKKSISLNLNTPKGREIMNRLFSISDVFVQNLAPHAMGRWGIAPEEVCAKYPHLIYCSVNGFGRNGPLKNKRALDTILQSMSGVVDLTGDPDGAPLKSGVSSADGSAATAAVGAILAALYYRERTGRGQAIDISMMDVMGWMTMEFWPKAVLGTETVTRNGNRSEYAAPQGVYRCADGYIAVSVQTDEQWASLQELLRNDGYPSFPTVSSLAGRRAWENEIGKALDAWAARKNADELEHRLQAGRIPASKVQEVHQVLEDPQLFDRGMIASLRDSDLGTIRVLGSPLRGSRANPVVTMSAPEVGENNYEIYHCLLNISQEELNDYANQNII